MSKWIKLDDLPVEIKDILISRLYQSVEKPPTTPPEQPASPSVTRRPLLPWTLPTRCAAIALSIALTFSLPRSFLLQLLTHSFIFIIPLIDHNLILNTLSRNPHSNWRKTSSHHWWLLLIIIPITILCFIDLAGFLKGFLCTPGLRPPLTYAEYIVSGIYLSVFNVSLCQVTSNKEILLQIEHLKVLLNNQKELTMVNQDVLKSHLEQVVSQIHHLKAQGGVGGGGGGGGDGELIELVTKQMSLLSDALIQQTSTHLLEKIEHIDCECNCNDEKNLKLSQLIDRKDSNPHYLRDIMEVLIQGASPNTINPDNNTVLHACAYWGYLDIASLLLAWGGDVTMLNPTQDTPLHIAASRGHYGLIDVLVRYGSDLNAQNQQGDTPLHIAINEGYVGAVSGLLYARSEVDLNVRNRDGWTLLQYAVLNKSAVMVDLLLHAGADPCVKGTTGVVPLEYATKMMLLDDTALTKLKEATKNCKIKDSS